MTPLMASKFRPKLNDASSGDFKNGAGSRNYSRSECMITQSVNQAKDETMSDSFASG